MRTRSQILPYNPEPNISTLVEYSPTYVPGPAGPQPCLPMVEIARSSVSESPSRFGSAQIKSVIIDNIDYGFPGRNAFKGCMHRTNEPPYYPPVDYVISFTGAKAAGDYWGPLLRVPGSVQSGSINPGVYAYSDIADQYNIYPESIESVLGLRIPAYTDRLASLPAKAITKLDGLHTSTMLIEARELPTLYRFLRGREKLLASGQGPKILALASKIKQSRKKLALTTIKAIASALGVTKEAYLSYVFCIAPTIDDTVKLVNEVSRSGSRGVRSVIVRAKGRYTSALPSKQQGRSSTMYVEAAGQLTIESERLDCLKVDWKRNVASTPFLKQSQEFMERYSGRNQLGLLWEVMPISFMIDWLVSIDDVLDTMWLNTHAEYNTLYWTTNVASAILDVRFTPVTTQSPFGVLGGTSVSNMTSKVRFYERTRRDPPSPLSSIRMRGDNAKALFHSLLIGSGLLRR